jgi:hypothetical protein
MESPKDRPGIAEVCAKILPLKETLFYFCWLTCRSTSSCIKICVVDIFYVILASTSHLLVWENHRNSTKISTPRKSTCWVLEPPMLEVWYSSWNVCTFFYLEWIFKTEINMDPIFGHLLSKKYITALYVHLYCQKIISNDI